jgi:hypothetical protein
MIFLFHPAAFPIHGKKDLLKLEHRILAVPLSPIRDGLREPIWS